MTAKEYQRIVGLLHEDLSSDLDRIRDRFKGEPKISLVIRFEELGDNCIYLTNDTTPEVIAAIQAREKESAVVIPMKEVK